MSLILGTAQLDRTYGVLGQSVRASGEDPLEFLQVAVDLGFAAIDTAPSYGDAEAIIGRSNVNIPVHTKISAGEDPERSVSRSLRRLGRSSIDIAYLHDPDAPLQSGSGDISAASRLVGGPIERLGVSIYTAEALAAALGNEMIDVIQLPVNPLLPSIVDSAATARLDSITLVARSVLVQGLLASDPATLPATMNELIPCIRKYQEACQVMERSPQEVALLWTRDHPLVDALIIGAASHSQLVELAHSCAQPPLSPDERMLIDSIALPAPSALDPRRWG